MALDKAIVAPLITEYQNRLAAAKTDEEKQSVREDFLDDFKESAEDIHTGIHQTGFNAGVAKGSKAGAKTTDKIKQLEAERDELKAQLEAAQKDKPDLNAVEEKWRGKLTAKEKEIEKEREDRARAIAS
jgi:DNA repair exonuclease SbcCD ATPase subunit